MRGLATALRHVDFEDLNGPCCVELGVENWRLFCCMLPHHRGFRLRVYFCTKMPATLVYRKQIEPIEIAVVELQRQYDLESPWRQHS